LLSTILSCWPRSIGADHLPRCPAVVSGTVSTDSNGTKTFRDGSGRTTGTATNVRTAPERGAGFSLLRGVTSPLVTMLNAGLKAAARQPAIFP